MRSGTMPASSGALRPTLSTSGHSHSGHGGHGRDSPTPGSGGGGGSGSGGGGGGSTLTLAGLAEEVKAVRHELHAVFVMMEWLVSKSEGGLEWIAERRQRVKPGATPASTPTNGHSAAAAAAAAGTGGGGSHAIGSMGAAAAGTPGGKEGGTRGSALARPAASYAAAVDLNAGAAGAVAPLPPRAAVGAAGSGGATGAGSGSESGRASAPAPAADGSARAVSRGSHPKRGPPAGPPVDHTADSDGGVGGGYTSGGARSGRTTPKRAASNARRRAAAARSGGAGVPAGVGSGDDPDPPAAVPPAPVLPVIPRVSHDAGALRCASSPVEAGGVFRPTGVGATTPEEVAAELAGEWERRPRDAFDGGAPVPPDLQVDLDALRAGGRSMLAQLAGNCSRHIGGIVARRQDVHVEWNAEVAAEHARHGREVAAFEESRRLHEELRRGEGEGAGASGPRERRDALLREREAAEGVDHDTRLRRIHDEFTDKLQRQAARERTSRSEFADKRAKLEDDLARALAARKQEWLEAAFAAHRSAPGLHEGAAAEGGVGRMEAIRRASATLPAGELAAVMRGEPGEEGAFAGHHGMGGSMFAADEPGGAGVTRDDAFLRMHNAHPLSGGVSGALTPQPSAVSHLDGMHHALHARDRPPVHASGVAHAPPASPPAHSGTPAIMASPATAAAATAAAGIVSAQAALVGRDT